MNLNTITLTPKEADMLADLLNAHNKGLQYKDQLTFQMLAEKILRNAIQDEYYKLRN